MVLTGVTEYIPAGIVWVYPLKTILVGLLLIGFRHHFPEIYPKRREEPGQTGMVGGTLFFLSIFVGIIVFVIWILPDRLGIVIPSFSESSAFNPFDHFQSANWTAVWIGFRLLGAAIVVPVMEELFWRSFLIRYLIRVDFKKVAIGAFSWVSFGVTVALFGVEHHRWLVGMIAGVIYNLLLYRTKSVFACIVAHAVTNLVLGIYVLATQQWGYW